MYNHLKGKVISSKPGNVILETAGGIGWDLHTPLSTSDFCRNGQDVTLLTHLVVREDAQLLYAFATEDERSLFRTLIGLSGVGAATAVQILSSVKPADFMIAIERQDTAFLKKIKGIGEKTAKRIILELKGAKTMLPDSAGGEKTLGGIGGDAVMALQAMGLPPKEALARVEKTLSKEPDLSLEDLVRKSLQG